jgi:hypothetical protein
MRFTRWLAIVLLILLAVGAVAGAVPMLSDPHGEPWQMPQSYLAHSPFHSYLIPGLILLAANGLLAFAVTWLALRRAPRYGLWIAFQGAVLVGWIVVECILLRMVAIPHYVYGVWGLILILCGLLLRHDDAPQIR